MNAHYPWQFAATRAVYFTGAQRRTVAGMRGGIGNKRRDIDIEVGPATGVIDCERKELV